MRGVPARLLRSSALVLLGAVSCGQDCSGSDPSTHQSEGSSNSGDAQSLSSVAVVESPSAVARCQHLIDNAQGQVGRAGPFGAGSTLAALTLEHDLAPVLWLRSPELAAGGAVVRAYRRRLRDSIYPGDLAERMVPSLTASQTTARAAYLREGILFAETPAVARVVVRHVRLRHLFSAGLVEVTRRGQRLRAERTRDGVYRWASGPLLGQRVRLALMDRLRVSGAPESDPPFRALSKLATRLGFTRLVVAHRGARRFVVELSYGRARTLALLDAGEKLDLVCEVPVGDAEQLLSERERLKHLRRVLAELDRAMDQQIALKLRFDEPKTEEGQQDGALRNAWSQAYQRGLQSYSFNGDRYRVYSRGGEPRAPQVCVDFITETLERASGTQFRKRGARAGPGKARGGIEFDDILGEHRRQVASLVDYSRGEQPHFDILDIRPGRWVPYEKLDRFHYNLAELSPNIRRGDILVIRGTVPWDRKRRDHYHSFFVTAVCPITGVPTRITGNALRPRTVSWRTEMSRAPKRSVRHRIRPRLDWLKRAFEHGQRATSAGDRGR